MKIQTKRLLLRKFKQDDFNELKKIINQPEIKRYVPIIIANNDEELKENLEEYIESYLNHIYIAIELNHKLIGMIICISIDDNTFDISYLISKEYINKGYCYEALKAFMKYLKKWKKEITLLFTIHEENKASQKLMEKLNIEKTTKRFNNHILYKST